MTCTGCNGKRVIVSTVPNVQRSNGVDYLSTRPAMVDRLEQCQRCNGSGHEPDPTPPGQITYYGCPIVAPGFIPESFQASLSRARSRGTLPMIPAGAGVVLVESSRAGERYRVTRETCSCLGGQSHGRCMHRAAAIAAADLYGIDVCHTHVLGLANGHPVTAADRLAQLGVVA